MNMKNFFSQVDIEKECYMQQPPKFKLQSYPCTACQRISIVCPQTSLKMMHLNMVNYTHIYVLINSWWYCMHALVCWRPRNHWITHAQYQESEVSKYHQNPKTRIWWSSLLGLAESFFANAAISWTSCLANMVNDWPIINQFDHNSRMKASCSSIIYDPKKYRKIIINLIYIMTIFHKLCDMIKPTYSMESGADGLWDRKSIMLYYLGKLLLKGRQWRNG